MNLFSVIFPVVIVFLTFIVLEVTARLGTGLLPDVVTRFLSDTCPVDAPSNGGGCVSAYQTCEYNETCCSNDASKCINATTCTCLGNVGKALWSCETVDSSLVGIMCSTSDCPVGIPSGECSGPSMCQYDELCCPDKGCRNQTTCVCSEIGGSGKFQWSCIGLNLNSACNDTSTADASGCPAHPPKFDSTCVGYAPGHKCKYLEACPKGSNGKISCECGLGTWDCFMACAGPTAIVDGCPPDMPSTGSPCASADLNCQFEESCCPDGTCSNATSCFCEPGSGWQCISSSVVCNTTSLFTSFPVSLLDNSSSPSQAPDGADTNAAKSNGVLDKARGVFGNGKDWAIDNPKIAIGGLLVVACLCLICFCFCCCCRRGGRKTADDEDDDENVEVEEDDEEGEDGNG